MLNFKANLNKIKICNVTNDVLILNSLLSNDLKDVDFAGWFAVQGDLSKQGNNLLRQLMKVK